MSILARTRPYPHQLRTCERVCKRCGIEFRIKGGARDQHITHCRDCRDTD